MGSSVLGLGGLSVFRDIAMMFSILIAAFRLG